MRSHSHGTSTSRNRFATLEEIRADILAVEQESAGLLDKILGKG